MIYFWLIPAVLLLLIALVYFWNRGTKRNQVGTSRLDEARRE